MRPHVLGNGKGRNGGTGSVTYLLKADGSEERPYSAIMWGYHCRRISVLFIFSCRYPRFRLPKVCHVSCELATELGDHVKHCLFPSLVKLSSASKYSDLNQFFSVSTHLINSHPFFVVRIPDALVISYVYLLHNRFHTKILYILLGGCGQLPSCRICSCCVAVSAWVRLRYG